ncbi:hypothetical protein KY363_02715 [Candidatus Woesearchaeota archaeon]|nr:hypothetical protein [Candidatus Woesearchaeota archaeon]
MRQPNARDANMKKETIQNLSYAEKKAIEDAAIEGVAITLREGNETYVPNKFYAMGATHLDSLPVFKIEQNDLYSKSIEANVDNTELTAEERLAVARPAAYVALTVGSSLKRAYNSLKDRLASRDVHEGIEAAIKAYVEQ